MPEDTRTNPPSGSSDIGNPTHTHQVNFADNLPLI